MIEINVIGAPVQSVPPLNEESPKVPTILDNALTAREASVLLLMADGNISKEISHLLGISTKTVEAHRNKIFKKLGARNLGHAVLLAVRKGLITP